MKIYHLTETVFHADPKDSGPGYDHTYNIIYTKSVRKALRAAKDVISFSDIEVMPGERCDNGCVSYRGGEPESVSRFDGRRYKKALRLKLKELRERGFAIIREGEYLSLDAVELEKVYDGFHTRVW